MIYYRNSLVFFVSFLFLNIPIFSADLIKGDESAVDGKTFSFNVQKTAMTNLCEYFYVTAKDSGGKNFAISRVAMNSTQFFPFAPELVELNGKDAQSNPLFNSGFKFISLLEDKKDKDVKVYPVLVKEDELNKVYIVNLSKYNNFKESGKISVFVFDSMKNYSQSPVTAINSIEASSAYIFSAVDIGTSDGGIAILEAVNISSSSTKSENKKPADTKADQEADKELNDLEQGKDAEDQKKKIVLSLVQNSVTSLTVDSNFVKIGDPLSSIAVSDMYWDSNLKCLFIALQVESGAGGTDGCKALLVGKILKEELEVNGKKVIATSVALQNFMPDAVFTNQNEIVGAVGANENVSLHKVKTMHSSNRLNYVIVLGGNGEPANTKKSVYALPLVTDYTIKANGKWEANASNSTQANKDSLPEDLFAGSIIKKMKFRFLKGAATSSSEILTSTHAQAQVGAGDLDYDISDIFVSGDAVFAQVDPEQANAPKTLFMSRALFDENGKIKRWTKWQAVSSSENYIFASGLDANLGNFIFVSGDDSNDTKTVKRTLWSAGDANGLQDLSNIMSREFPKNLAGIQGLFEFPYSDSGAPLGMKNITMLVATGYKKVVLAELAKIDTGQLVRNTGDFSGKVVSMTGDALDKIGPIVSSVVTFTDSGRLFVGGVFGVAVLVDKTTGEGWDLSSGLGPNFAGLTGNMVFKTVGDFKFVKKMVQDDNYLYILTDKKLYRVDLLGANDFLNGKLDLVKIADFESIEGISKFGAFSDFVVSGKLGILATTVGLFRVGNGKNIVSDNDLDWTKVDIPSDCGPVKQLLAVSQTLREQDVFKENSDGVLYVLSAYHGKDVAQFNRFTINYSSQINNNTILPLPDYFVEVPGTSTGSHSYFVNYGTFRNLFEDEGALRYSSAERDLLISPFVKLSAKNLVSGSVLSIIADKMLYLSIKKNSDVVKILRSSTGPIFVAGDFGLKVNE